MSDELAERVAAIAGDRRHGASELARRCLEVLADAALSAPADSSAALLATLRALADQLIASRPSMTPVARLLTLWQQRCQAAHPLSEQRDAAREAALALIAESRAATQAAAGHAAALLTDCRTLATYSYSSTVAESLTRLAPETRVIFSESRPLNEGHRLAALLSRHGRRGTLVTDAQLGAALRVADAVLVGADTVLSDGALVNKAGTLPLAATAARFDVPFYVCCESHKLRTAELPPLTLERMSAAELTAPGWPGIDIENVYFDVTPADLLCGCITEAGLQRFADYRGASA